MWDPMSLSIVAVVGVVAASATYNIVYTRRKEKKYQAVHERTVRLGLTLPASLHPKIDETNCICTGACVTACPEKDVMGMIDGKPKLINPSACIGHGECLRSCPVDAITLIIGSEKRGVELPMLGKDFQTNVPGLYIAGELGGMGLIHNAVNQGGQAMRALGASLQNVPRVDGVHQVVIVGAGPAGIAAGAQAKHLKLDYSVLEQEQAGGAVRSFPRQKIVMTAPAQFALYGKVKLRRTTKEALLELWEQIIAKIDLQVEGGVKVNEIKRGPDGVFTIETTKGPRRAQRVLLAIGRRGTPRKLGVPGETLDKVTYKLLEPEQYKGTRCLVVGGGDSAVESAIALAKQPNTTVTLSHRGDKFDRIKPGNFDLLENARETGLLKVLTSSKPKEITAEHAILEQPEGPLKLENDYVFVLIGGELPTAWLAKIGITVKTFKGEAFPTA